MFKNASEVRSLPGYEMYSDASLPTKTIENPYLRSVAQVLFGDNIAPSRRDGEDMRDAMLRRDRNIALTRLKSKSLLTNPIVEQTGLGEKLSPLVGGNFSKAINNLHENLSGANIMGAFNQQSPNDVQDTMEALKNNMYKKSSQIIEAIKYKLAKDKLEGGAADNMPDSRYPEKELNKGKLHEKEHVKDPQIAKEIAKDHLEENKGYYTKLEKAKID